MNRPRIPRRRKKKLKKQMLRSEFLRSFTGRIKIYTSLRPEPAPAKPTLCVSVVIG